MKMTRPTELAIQDHCPHTKHNEAITKIVFPINKRANITQHYTKCDSPMCELIKKILRVINVLYLFLRVRNL